MISIVIPLYNKAHKIEETLNSVLAQTFQDFEIIIVDDGSTDGSAEIVAELKDSRIRIISQENAGVSAARNRGIQESKGEYVAFLDADDQWYPEYLSSINALINRHKDCDVFTVGYEFIDENGNKRPSIVRCKNLDDERCLSDRYFHIASISDAPLWTSAVVASKMALISSHGFPEGVTSGEDLITWAKLAAKYRIARLNKTLAKYYTPTTGPTGKVPCDLTSTNDAVGNELIRLSDEFPKRGITEYVSFWYKMRAVINLNRRNRIPAFKCAVKAVKYNPRNVKAWGLMALSFMPEIILNKIIHK
nr:glycosyltransferase family 2 protein [Bacteroides sp.]